MKIFLMINAKENIAEIISDCEKRYGYGAPLFFSS